MPGWTVISRGLSLTLARAAVGDRYVLEEMNKGGFNVGGEQSGHIILSDFSTTGDGLIAALQVLAVLARGRQAGLRGGASLRAAAAGAGECALPQRLAAGRCRVKSSIDAANARLGDSGRVLVRKSGTEPLIRVMAEGDDEKTGARRGAPDRRRHRRSGGLSPLCTHDT